MGAEGQESMERDLICAKDCVPFESEMMVKGGGGGERERETSHSSSSLPPLGFP